MGVVHGVGGTDPVREEDVLPDAHTPHAVDDRPRLVVVPEHGHPGLQVDEPQLVRVDRILARTTQDRREMTVRDVGVASEYEVTGGMRAQNREAFALRRQIDPREGAIDRPQNPPGAHGTRPRFQIRQHQPDELVVNGR